MATSEETRVLLEVKNRQRRDVIAAGVRALITTHAEPKEVAAASIVETALLALAELWHQEAAKLETSTKHGAKKTRERLRDCAGEIAGFASGLSKLASVPLPTATNEEPRPAEQPELSIGSVVSVGGIDFTKIGNDPFGADGVPPEIKAEATDYTAYLSGESDVMPQPAVVSPVAVPRVVDPAPARPPRLTWEQLAGIIVAMPTPDHGSFSTISDLSECGVKYALTRAARNADSGVKPEVPAWWNIGGKAFHSAVETIERTFMVTDSMPSFDAEKAWQAHFQNAIAEAVAESDVKPERFRAADKGKENYDFWRVTGPELLAKYMAYWAPKRNQGWKILTLPDGRPGLELALTLDVNGWPFEVVIDQVWQRPDAALMIDDLKSGGSIPSSTFQLGGYAHALAVELSRSGEPLPIAGGFYKARAGSHDREVPDLLALHPWQELAMRVYAARTVIETKAYLPRVSDWAGGCGSCSHKLICPARAGDDLS